MAFPLQNGACFQILKDVSRLLFSAFQELMKYFDVICFGPDIFVCFFAL